jgi:hypothetical protein
MLIGKLFDNVVHRQTFNAFFVSNYFRKIKIDHKIPKHLPTNAYPQLLQFRNCGWESTATQILTDENTQNSYIQLIIHRKSVAEKGSSCFGRISVICRWQNVKDNPNFLPNFSLKFQLYMVDFFARDVFSQLFSVSAFLFKILRLILSQVSATWCILNI